MTHSTLTPDYSAIAAILTEADWTYTYHNDGSTDKETLLEEYISCLEDSEVTEEMLNGADFNLEDYKEGDIDVYCARQAADYVAQKIVDCIYPDVTFTIL